MSSDAAGGGRGGSPTFPARRDLLSVSRGEVVFIFPSTLTQDDHDDIIAWLGLVQAKLKRFVESPAGRAALLEGEET